MYAQSNDPSFDNETLEDIIKKYKEQKLTCANDEQALLPGGIITEGEIWDIIKDLKKRKACGPDKIQNEHLFYGGKIIARTLAFLFNNIVLQTRVPKQWKHGFIVPIYKGGNKIKSSPDSYRPVCLLSCILKVFEKLLLSRLQTHVLTSDIFPNPLQQGFQSGLGCLTASFIFQETIFHNLELHSNVYAAFLDSRKAFDTVWRKALMYKLFKLKVTGKAWCIIDDLYTNTESAVVMNQCKSRFFSVNEGVRQDGILSGMLYLVFINDLLTELEKCNAKMGVDYITSCAPCLADDIVCLANSPVKLQQMLNICSSYASKWRFQFSASKSYIMCFCQTRSKPNYQWTMNRQTIPITDKHTYLGIEVCDNLKSTSRINAAVRKGRNSYFAITNIRTQNINPMALLKLYKSVVIPTCLYGCEFWSGLKNQDILKLNRLQHFIVKNIQRFKTQTRSDMCESMVGLNPLICEVEKRKLYLFGKLCRMEPNIMSKQIFLVRLFSCLQNSNLRNGFVPDVLHIIQKYKLCEFLQTYLNSGSFPSKYQWKNIVISAINSVQYELWNDRVTSDPDFIRFKQIHSNIFISQVWKWPSSTFDLRKAFFIAKLIVTVPIKCVSFVIA